MTRNIALLSVLAIIGCAGSQNGGGFSIDTISGINWQLDRMALDTEEISPVESSLISFSCLPDGEVAGSASINRYNTSLITDGSRILRWNPFRVTRMSGAPELMDQENLFLTALPQTTRFLMSGQKLIFENEQKGIRLEFSRLSE